MPSPLPPDWPRTFEDQMGRTIELPDPPRRIVSLVPSQTELLFDLGAGERVVGATRFCIHPAGPLERVKRVGGTKQVSIDRVEALQPDLIIGNKEENERDQIEALAGRWPVWLSDVDTLETAVDMIRSVGELVDAQGDATALAEAIGERFDALPSAGGVRVAYAIWRRPWMFAARGTFIDDLLGRCGFVNVIAEAGLERYPELDAEQLRGLRPDTLLLSSEPFPFAAKHVHEAEALVPGARAKLVDGEAFSWFGSRLVPAAETLATLAREIAP